LANATNAEVEKSVKLVAKTAAPDGMIFDENGTLYFADLEQQNYVPQTRWQYSHPSGR
jgi:sugar lactone lactonase YvrE